MGNHACVKRREVCPLRSSLMNGKTMTNGAGESGVKGQPHFHKESRYFFPGASNFALSHSLRAGFPLCYDISGGKKITIVTSEDRCGGHSFILGFHRWILLWPSKAIASNQSATCTIHHLHPQTFQWLWHQWNLQTRNGVAWILQVWTWSLSVFFRHIIWMLLVANMDIQTHPFMSLGWLPAQNLVSMRHIQWTST